MANRNDEDGVERWTFEKIVDHQSTTQKQGKPKIELLVKCEGYQDETWEPMDTMQKDDPVTIAKYTKENNLINLPEWKWARRYVKKSKTFLRLYRQTLKSKKKIGIKYQFRVRVLGQSRKHMSSTN